MACTVISRAKDRSDFELKALRRNLVRFGRQRSTKAGVLPLVLSLSEGVVLTLWHQGV